MSVPLTLLPLLMAALAAGQQCQTGQCPVMEDFQVHLYDGFWYEFKKYSEIPLRPTKCNSVYYQIIEGTYTAVGFLERSVLISDKTTITAEGTLVPVVQMNTTNQSLSLASFTIDNGARPVPERQPKYNVLYTDYENYTIVSDCDKSTGPLAEKLKFLTSTITIMTRTKTPSQATQENSEQKLRSFLPNLTACEATPVIQTGCPSLWQME